MHYSCSPYVITICSRVREALYSIYYLHERVALCLGEPVRNGVGSTPRWTNSLSCSLSLGVSRRALVIAISHCDEALDVVVAAVGGMAIPYQHRQRRLLLIVCFRVFASSRRVDPTRMRIHKCRRTVCSLSLSSVPFHLLRWLIYYLLRVQAPQCILTVNSWDTL